MSNGERPRTPQRTTTQPRGDRWTALARQGLRSDPYQTIAALTVSVIDTTDARKPLRDRIDAWEEATGEGIACVLATLSVGLRVLRNVVG